jgi:hypothetical protein
MRPVILMETRGISYCLSQPDVCVSTAGCREPYLGTRVAPGSDHSPRLVSRSGMRGVIPPLPQYAFMVWHPVKKEIQGQLYLYLFDKVYRLCRWNESTFEHFHWFRDS